MPSKQFFKAVSKDNALRNLGYARNFIGQAQESLKNTCECWKDLGRIYDELDSMIEAIEEEEA